MTIKLKINDYIFRIFLIPGRVDHKERDAMIEEDRMEFMWRGSDVLG